MILRRVFVAILLLLLVDTVAWAALCRRLEQGVQEAAAIAPQSGWSFTASQESWAGWPLAAAIDLRAVSAAGTILPGFVWRAERTRVEVAFFHPKTLSIRVGGAQSVEAQGVPAIPLTADRTNVAVDLTGAAPLQAELATVKAVLPNGAITLDRAEMTFPPNQVTAEFTGLSLPGVAMPIRRIRLRANIEPALPVAATPQISAHAWQQAGGHIDIAEAVLDWDTLVATGAGKITLDTQLQPQAEGTVQATGLPGLLDDLARAGTLTAAQAGAAKAVIAILAAPTGGERVQLPVSLETGVLRLARFPLARFPPLALD